MTMKTIPFDLEKAKAGAKVVCGEISRIPVLDFHYFDINTLYPLHVVLDERGGLLNYFTKSGQNAHHRPDPNSDLFLLVEPKLRPWKPEEVPVGALIRRPSSLCDVGEHAAMLIVERDKHRVYAANCKQGSTFAQCLDDHEHSLDHGKTWLPCGVEE